MKSRRLDLNADVGEGLNNEALLLPYLNSCSVACGGHAGEGTTIREVITLANHYNVKLGAHPSFPDRKNFGRKVMDISAADLYTSLREQIRFFMNILRETRTQINHIKPHGALYNLAVYDEKTAMVIIEVIKGISIPLKLFAPYNSLIADKAKAAGIEVLYEGFADRNYNDDYSLVDRIEMNSLITEPEDVEIHIRTILEEGMVRTISGKKIPLQVDTICVHGDNKNARIILQHLTQSY